MKTGMPLFGTAPVQSSLGQVETLCVKRYPESATRPPMWEGFRTAHARILDASAPGEVWVSGEFVVDEEDPNYTQVHLRVPPGVPITEEISDVISWINDPNTTEKLSCDLSVIAEVPDDDALAPLVREQADFILDFFTAHGEFGRKGFPILPLFSAP